MGEQFKIDDVISEDEQRGWLSIMALNRLDPYEEFRRRWNWGRFQFSFRLRSSKMLMGRLGAGWQWGIGIQGSKSSILLYLLICSLRISWKRITK